MIHRLVAVLALVAIGISVPAASTPVHAARWADGPCTDNVGITIVIDFQELGGGVNVACAPGSVTSGLDALNKAGIAWEGARRLPGFLCRIAGLPGPDTEACVNTPPANAYWSYWIAPRGGPWCYSTTGAGSRTPPPGAVEGWSFSVNHLGSDIPPPRLDPPAPIPGEPPNPVRGGDCGSPASGAPTPPPATPAPTVAQPATTIAAAPPAPPTSAVLAEPDSASTAVPAPDQGSNGPNSATTSPQPATAAGSSTTTVAAASTTSTIASSTTRPQNAATGTLDTIASGSAETSSPTGDSVPLGTVDLGDDGRGDGGFSPAAGLGLLIAAGVGGSSVWVARRRRMGPPP